ncbi:hypothetical protein CYLTODRAFT_362701, partial [Cylindrobasidium torrendii FP15055 ss-10]
LYEHHIMRVHYTTYDIQRDYDTINPRSHPFVMLNSPDNNAHPYWYAQVLGIYHANVIQYLDESHSEYAQHSVQFLYVRWLGDEPNWTSGRRVARLPKVGFVDESDPYAFGFLDPNLILRGSHLIPSFVDGRTDTLLAHSGPTLARPEGIDSDIAPMDGKDWTNYYVGIFVDRDMVMRYFGAGIGHTLRHVQEDAGVADKDVDDAENYGAAGSGQVEVGDDDAIEQQGGMNEDEVSDFEQSDDNFSESDDDRYDDF